MKIKKVIIFALFLSINIVKIQTDNKFLCRSTDSDMECDLEYISNYNPLRDNSQIKKANNKLKILEYNIDKSGFGGDSPFEKGGLAILEYLLTLNNFDKYDVIILVEVARDCVNWDGGMNYPELFAKNLQMNYVYGVEYYLPIHSTNNNQCTIGNAILSKYKLDNVDQLIFKSQAKGYSDQVGRRLAVHADITINDKTLRLYSIHLESGTGEIESVVKSFGIRNSQSREIISHIDAVKTNYADFIVAGDFNAPLISLDYSIRPFYQNGYKDSMNSLWFNSRITAPFINGTLRSLKLGDLDYIFCKNGNFNNVEIFGGKDKFYGLSDHHPIKATYDI